MEQSLIREIIRKFLEGTCNDEEFAYLLSWYESFDEAEALQMTEEEKQELEKALLTNILRRIPDLQNRLPDEKKNQIKLRTGSRAWLKYTAAALVIGLFAGVGWWTIKQVHQVTELNKQQVAGFNQISLNNMTQRMYLITLSDSTRVWLSPNSNLEYPDKFTGKERIVHLKGEAFFEVSKDPAHPFVIYSDRLITRVWGTSFLVKSIEGKPAEVSVLTGRVSVQKKGAHDEIVILYPHQKAVLDAHGQLIKEEENDQTSMQRWEKINLTFDNTPFSDVIASLEKHFDVQIRCADAGLLNLTLTGDFNEQHLSDVLELIEKSLNVHYRIVNDSVIEVYTTPDGSP